MDGIQQALRAPEVAMGPRRRLRSLRGDRGSTTLELVIVFPVFLAIVFSAVQAAMWWHARNLCLSAAQTGLQAGRVSGGSPAAAQDSAHAFLTRTGGSAATDPQVRVVSTSGTLRVEVSATALRVFPIPGMDLHLTQVAEGPREVFTTPRQGSAP